MDKPQNPVIFIVFGFRYDNIFIEKEIAMVSFVQDIGGGNKLVWDLDNPDDANAFTAMIITIFILGCIAAVGFGIYYLFF